MFSSVLSFPVYFCYAVWGFDILHNFDLNVRILTKQQQNLQVKTGKTDLNIYVNRQASSWNMTVKWLYDTMLLLFHM